MSALVRCLSFLPPFVLAVAANAATTVTIAVSDIAGHPLADAVVYALPAAGQSLNRAPRDAIVDQIDREFVPLVTPLQTGAAVRFPNKDNIRHQVYSFSGAKTFTLKLYSGVSAQPVIFDKAGEVVLGCNIHDHMVAYIYVVDTPFFAKTDARGEARLMIDAAGEFELRAWHPDQKAPVAGQPWRSGDAAATNLRMTIELAPRRPMAGPNS